MWWVHLSNGGWSVGFHDLSNLCEWLCRCAVKTGTYTIKWEE